LAKISARIVQLETPMTYRVAGAVVRRRLFQQILVAIATLRPSPPVG
jgi:hypothetical protein